LFGVPGAIGGTASYPVGGCVGAGPLFNPAFVPTTPAFGNPLVVGGTTPVGGAIEVPGPYAPGTAGAIELVFGIGRPGVLKLAGITPLPYGVPVPPGWFGFTVLPIWLLATGGLLIGFGSESMHPMQASSPVPRRASRPRVPCAMILSPVRASRHPVGDRGFTGG
jgi:hypothetical protein